MTDPFNELDVSIEAARDVPEGVVAEHAATYPGAHEYVPSTEQVNLKETSIHRVDLPELLAERYTKGPVQLNVPIEAGSCAELK